MDIFTNYSKIGVIQRPVAIMHGDQDEVVPIVNGQTLRELSPNKVFPPLWIQNHGHNDMPLRECRAYTASFLRSLEIELASKAPSEVS